MRDEDERKVLEKELKRWEETTLRDALASHPERRKEFVTTSNRPGKRLYTPLDLAGKTDRYRLGAPGDFPLTRAIHPTRYSGRPWTVGTVAGYGGAEGTHPRGKDPPLHPDAGARRHIRIRHPAGGGVEHDLDQRLPHPRGGSDGRPGTRVHARERHGVRPVGDRQRTPGGRLRTPSFVLLHRAHRSVRRTRQVPRGASHLGARDAGHLRREESAIVAVAVPHADRGG